MQLAGLQQSTASVDHQSASSASSMDVPDSDPASGGGSDDEGHLTSPASDGPVGPPARRQGAGQQHVQAGDEEEEMGEEEEDRGCQGGKRRRTGEGGECKYGCSKCRYRQAGCSQCRSARNSQRLQRHVQTPALRAGAGTGVAATTPGAEGAEVAAVGRGGRGGRSLMATLTILRTPSGAEEAGVAAGAGLVAAPRHPATAATPDTATAALDTPAGGQTGTVLRRKRQHEATEFECECCRIENHTTHHTHKHNPQHKHRKQL